MSTFAQEKMMRAPSILIQERGDYYDYFSQGESGMWALTNEADRDAPQALLDAQVASMGTNTIQKD